MDLEVACGLTDRSIAGPKTNLRCTAGDSLSGPATGASSSRGVGGNGANGLYCNLSVVCRG